MDIVIGEFISFVGKVSRAIQLGAFGLPVSAYKAIFDNEYSEQKI